MIIVSNILTKMTLKETFFRGQTHLPGFGVKLLKKMAKNNYSKSPKIMKNYQKDIIKWRNNNFYSEKPPTKFMN